MCCWALYRFSCGMARAGQLCFAPGGAPACSPIVLDRPSHTPSLHIESGEDAGGLNSWQTWQRSKIAWSYAFTLSYSYGLSPLLNRWNVV